MSDPIEVLDFWLGEIGPAGWFAGGGELDTVIAEKFGDVWQAAREGGLEHWVEGAAGTLAYLVICDQMSRNMHRGRAEAFATDAQALAAARTALAAGWDMEAPEPERMFFYLPFEHSEMAEDQDLSVQLMSGRLSDGEMALHGRAHQEVIRRFGRFPFRNAALGRASTPEEMAFLDGGGYGEVVKALRDSHADSA
jgi:uncharacterized protein (DUF924 family)